MSFSFSKWEIRVDRPRFSFSNDIEIMIRMRADPRHGPDYMMTFVPHEIKDEERGIQQLRPDNMVLAIPDQIAQDLMDQLWACGLRPTEGSGSAGSLKATQDHLADMQKLSWRLLDMIEKEEANERQTDTVKKT